MKTTKRLIAFLLALIMMLSLSTVAFAEETAGMEKEEALLTEETVPEEEPAETPAAPEDESTPAEEPTEESAEEPTEELVEIPAEEPTETPAEEPNEEAEEEQPAEEPAEEPTEETEEEPAEEEKPEEAEPAPVKVALRFAEPFRAAVPADAESTDATPEYGEDGEEITGYALELLLPAGDYDYFAQAVGYRDATGTFTVPEDAEEIDVELAMEAYPYGLKGMALDYKATADDIGGRKFMAEQKTLSTLEGLKPGKDYVADEVMFTAKNREEALAIAEAYNGELVSFGERVGVIRLGEQTTVVQAITAFSDSTLRLPRVEPNYIVHIDDPKATGSSFKEDAKLLGTANTVTWQIWKEAMEEVGTPDPFIANPQMANAGEHQHQHDLMNTYAAWGLKVGNSSVRVVVIDSGINPDHEDLYISGMNYYPDDEYGIYDAVDANGHGTHCAGIIGAAMGNGLGGAGVAPGVSLYSYRALNDEGYGGKAGFAAGIYWAIANGADVISMSLGGYYPSEIEKGAIEEAVKAGITVVVAAGNDGSNIKEYPAAYSIPGMITVGAVDRSRAKASYTNTGAWVDVYAPGTDIVSTVNGGSSSYDVYSGTSMATPCVAGVCALYYSVFGHKGVSPLTVEKAIKSSVTNGVVDAYKAISKGYKAAGLSILAFNGDEDCTDRFKGKLSLPANITLSLSAPDLAEGESIVFTTDGTSPAFLDGKLVNGQIYDGTGISLADFAAGSNVTVTAVCAAENGEMGEPLTRTFQVMAAETKESAGKETPEAAEETAAPENPETAEAPAVPAANTVTIKKITKVGVYDAGWIGNEQAVSGKYDKNGYLKSAVLYAADLPDTDCEENKLVLNAKIWYVDTYATNELDWYSSNPNVAGLGLDESGNIIVTGLHLGKATITAKAKDGSGKKASVTVTVKAPASYVDIKSSAKPAADGYYYLAPGKSATHKAVLGATYGKPSGAKTYWEAQLVCFDDETEEIYNTWDPGTYFTISASGKLTLKKSVTTLPYFYDMEHSWYIDVYAYTVSDGYYWVSNSMYYTIASPITKMVPEYRNIQMACEYDCALDIYTYVGSGYSWNGEYTVTSSNPNVCGAFYDSEYGGVALISGSKKGKATIKVKANDGSGKSCSIKVSVSPYYYGARGW